MMDDLNKAVTDTFVRYKGRLIEKRGDGKCIVSGLLYNNLGEAMTAIDESFDAYGRVLGMEGRLISPNKK